MITIIHGDNTVTSRKALVELLDSYREKRIDVEQFAAKSLGVSQLEESLGGQSLFGGEKVIVVEELHSQPDSAKRKALVKMLAEASVDVIVWEKRVLTAVMLKKFGQAKVDTHKASNILFSWLDTLGKKNDIQHQLEQLHEICAKESAQFCFSMICRQIRLLIAATDDGQLKGAPFIIAKLKKQSQLFSLPQLLQLHSKLLEIEYAQKRALSKLTMEQQLDLLVISI